MTDFSGGNKYLSKYVCSSKGRYSLSSVIYQSCDADV